MSQLMDGLTVHQNVGTLHLIAGRRIMPRGGGENQVNIIDTNFPVADVYLLHNTVTDRKLRALHLMGCYSYFYSQVHEGISDGRLVGAMYSMMSNIVDEKIFVQNRLLDAFKQAGFKLDCYILRDEKEIMHFFEQKAKGPEFMKILNDFKPFVSNRKLLLVMMGPIFLTMAKNINSAGYSNWMKNRIRGFSGRLAVHGEEYWTPSQYPTQSHMEKSSRLLSSSFELRRMLFVACVRVAGIGQSFYSLFFRDIVSLMSGAEMSFLLLIDYYIFSKYPELLRIRALRDKMDTYLAAWQFMSTIPEDEKLFVKILYPRDKTSILIRTNFTLLAQVATAVAQAETPSMANYQGGQKFAANEQLCAIVTNYIVRRIGTAQRAIASAPAAQFSGEEYKLFNKLLKKDEEDGNVVGFGPLAVSSAVEYAAQHNSAQQPSQPSL